MGLSDRGRRQRLPLELGEQPLEVVTELGTEHGGDVVARGGGHPVLQQGELGTHVGGQQIDARGGDLAELDVHPTGLLQHTPEPHGLAVSGTAAVGVGDAGGEALASGEPEQLSIAPEDRHPLLHRP